jgi:hypothetical protein
MIRVTRQIKCLITQAPRGHPLPEVNFLMVEILTPKPYIFMIRVTRQIKCLIPQAPRGHTPPLPEVNFLMVEIPTLKPYIYSLFSYLFITQDQMIMTCNSAVASLMLSRFFYFESCSWRGVLDTTLCESFSVICGRSLVFS